MREPAAAETRGSEVGEVEVGGEGREDRGEVGSLTLANALESRPVGRQCVQIFFVKMRKLLLKMREKMRQPKMSFFYFIFGRFRVGLLF